MMMPKHPDDFMAEWTHVYIQYCPGNGDYVDGVQYGEMKMRKVMENWRAIVNRQDVTFARMWIRKPERFVVIAQYGISPFTLVVK